MLLSFALAASLSTPLGDEQILAVQYAGGVHSLDPAGGSTEVGDSGFVLLNSMARDSRGGLYTAAGGSFQNEIVRLDPATGAGTSVFQTRLCDIRALAFGPEDILLAMVAEEGTGQPFDLVRINLETEKVFPIGTIDAGIQGMAFGHGRLYAWHGPLGLVTIDLQTAAVTDVNPDAGFFTNLQSLAFDPEGNLYGADDTLYSIDRHTGIPTAIGPTGVSGGVRGIEFL